MPTGSNVFFIPIKLLRAALLAIALAPAPALALPSVAVLADSSLSLPLAEAARLYSKKYNIVVNGSFAPANMQEAQINEGSAADVLITPRLSWIEELKGRGLLDVYSQAPVTRDALVLAGPADSFVQVDLRNRFPVAEIIRAIDYEPLFVLPNPEALAEGAMAKEAMRNIDAADYMEPYTVYLKQREDIVEMLTQHGAYGVLLASTVRQIQGLRVLGEFPPSLYKPFEYFSVVIAGDNMDEARKFAQFLRTAEVQAIFERAGFREPVEALY